MAFPEKLIPTRRQAVIGTAVVALFLVGLFAYQAFSASRALLDARRSAETVQRLIQAGDFDGANAALADLRDEAHRAHSRTGNLLWDIGGHIPYFGRNIAAVQTVADVLDTTSSINAPIALQLSRALNEGTFRPSDGKINLPEVEKLTPQVQEAAASIESAGHDLDAINADSLLFPFNDMVGKLQDQFDEARSASKATATAFELLPNMLGKSGPRNYLFIVQNPAELRASGGLPGSIAILRAEGGRLTMGWQGSANGYKFGSPVLTLPKDVAQMYGTTPATDLRDFNFLPNFPVSAQVARQMTKDLVKQDDPAKRARDQIPQYQGDIDGVISVDPIAMSYVLASMDDPKTPSVYEGVQVDGKNLNALNVVPQLLNQIYVDKRTDLVGQDAFFADAAKTIFNAVMSGQGNQQVAVRGLGTATSQHRVLLWSNHPEEEAKLAGTAISGDLIGKSGSSPQVGMYLNDSTASKMDYYLQYRSSVSAEACRQKGAQDLRATISLKSTIPKNFGDLGVSVLGTGEFAKPGQIGFNMRLYAPYGGEITDLQLDGVTQSITADEDSGRQVAFLPITLKPGQESIVTAEIRTANGQDGNGTFSFTPGMVPAPNGTKIISACS